MHLKTWRGCCWKCQIAIESIKMIFLQVLIFKLHEYHICVSTCPASASPWSWGPWCGRWLWPGAASRTSSAPPGCRGPGWRRSACPGAARRGWGTLPPCSGQHTNCCVINPLHYTYLCLERGLEGFGRFVKNPFLYSLPFLKYCFFFPWFFGFDIWTSFWILL